MKSGVEDFLVDRKHVNMLCEFTSNKEGWIVGDRLKLILNELSLNYSISLILYNL